MALMRRCGRGEAECVVFFVEHGASKNTDLVHPVHTAGSGGFEVDSGWLGTFAARQAAERIIVRAQFHTHPGVAYHSTTDDTWPMVGTPGFISIVVPRF